MGLRLVETGVIVARLFLAWSTKPAIRWDLRTNLFLETITDHEIGNRNHKTQQVRYRFSQPSVLKTDAIIITNSCQFRPLP